ncbi:hypothetical protein OS493_010111 [Desmophyllum pertusum]|uniref:Delta-like protein n=1 Tax=Desmophyllum pertusum TaxID=174260 RepID=A0A9W9YEG0_9CNID|nr:hypothetical protein OS493_010111 [Desmophyllum pertusum]
MDHDAISADDLMDRYQRQVTVTPTWWASPIKWQEITLGGKPSTTVVKYSVKCNQDYYGPSCTKYCVSRDDDTAGHYTCDKATGHKICRAGWHGASCKVYCVAHDNDIRGHYTCEANTGERFVFKAGMDQAVKYTVPLGMTRWRVTLAIPRGKGLFVGLVRRECLRGWFGVYCDVFCSPRNDSAGHYICHSGTGAKECLPNWFGENCTVYCKFRNGSLGQHECTVNGSRLCARNWYGPNCTVYCASRNDNAGHYTCHPQTGQMICNQDWYGGNCTTYCVPQDSDWFGHYNCNKMDGSKQCHMNWYGTQCSLFCAPHDDSNGHYTCDRTNGSRVCLDDWFGSECKTYCKAMNSSQGHYHCGVEDGTKICHQDWFGAKLLQFTVHQEMTLRDIMHATLATVARYVTGIGLVSIVQRIVCRTTTPGDIMTAGLRTVLRFVTQLGLTTTHPPERSSSPSSVPSPSTELKITEYIISTPVPPSVPFTELRTTEYSTSTLLSTEARRPVDKESRKAAKESWMTNTRIGFDHWRLRASVVPLCSSDDCFVKL